MHVSGRLFMLGGSPSGAVPALRKWNERPGQFVIIGGGLRAAERAL